MAQLTQSELVEIYSKLKKILKKYEPPFISKIDLDSRYDLWSIKDVEIEGRKRKEVWFAGLIIQSHYVGFYYMPVYADTEVKKILSPRLLKCLKGKSCFYIKQIDVQLLKDIEDALDKGFKLYKEWGWV